MRRLWDHGKRPLRPLLARRKGLRNRGRLGRDPQEHDWEISNAAVEAEMITDLLAQKASVHPRRQFAVTDHGSYSFEEIDGAARRYAQRLRLAGVREGDHVSLIAGNHAGYLVAWFAINFAGAVAVTLNT